MTMGAIAAIILLFAITFLKSLNAEEFNFEGETFPTMVETTPMGIGKTECCTDDECISLFGENSICWQGSLATSATCTPEGLPGLRKKRGVEGMEDFTQRTGDSGLAVLAGTCECVDGLYLVDAACVEITECCTNGDCEPTLGVNSFCGLSEHVSTAFCVGESLFGPLRRKREAGFSTSDFRETVLPGGTTATPSTETGRCFCDEGFDTIDGVCVFIEPFDGNNDTNIGTTVQPSLHESNSCNLLTCDGNNCTEYIGDQTCARNESSPCYASKQCLDDGERFTFGCEDGCMMKNGTMSAPCYTVSCDTNLCNNHTTLLEIFICNSADGNLSSGRKVFLTFVFLPVIYISHVTCASE